jgi:ABC-2 type transport system permease protein
MNENAGATGRGRSLLLLPAVSLWWREMVRFLRQPNRVFGALGQPLVFWLLLGSGLGSSFRPSSSGDEVSYLTYLYPGTMTLILLFTAIFATISIIEDRKEGFLQSVLVAPVSRAAIVLGKVLGAATLATAQARLLVLLAPLLGISITPATVLALTAVLFLVAFGLASLGFLISWRMDSTQGFHAIMNVLLIPMWLLSGAFFPAEGAPGWLAWVMRLNPLSYGMTAIRGILDGGMTGQAGSASPSPAIALAVAAAASIIAFAAAILLARRPDPGGVS